jgi:uncharacterized protein YkwD
MRSKRTVQLIIIGLAAFQLLFLTAAIPVHTLTSHEVIAAVNALRASYGLPTYAVDNLLMLDAQGQADYLASIAPNIGNGHIGPGGTDADARALALGYPYVEGLDINENWASIPLGMSIEYLIATGWSDEMHMNTMLHERGQYIGVGVAVSGSTAYIVVDVAAYWGDAGLTSQEGNSASGSNIATQQAVSNFVAPVVLAESQGDGSVVHLAQSGQSLWLLAHHYDVSIDRLRELNQMGTDDVIYIGQEILIRPPTPATTTPENQPSITEVSQTASIQRVIETSNPSLIEKKEGTRGSDMDLYYLLFFATFGIGLILVVIGIQRR